MTSEKKTVTIHLDGVIVWEAQLRKGEVLFDGLRSMTLTTDFFHMVRPKSPRGRKKIYTQAEIQAHKHRRWKEYYRANREQVLQRAKDKRAADRIAKHADQTK